MRKMFLWLFSAVLFLTLPALAQHGGHASGGSHGFGGGRGDAHATQHAQAPVAHGGARAALPHSGYHYSTGGARAAWRGGRFDHEFFVGHWGAYHPFYWGACNWWGPRFYPGSYFWFGGAYFVIVDPIPDYWYDDQVYVDEYDGGYWLVNPLYPGVRFAVTVRF